MTPLVERRKGWADDEVRGVEARDEGQVLSSSKALARNALTLSETSTGTSANSSVHAHASSKSSMSQHLLQNKTHVARNCKLRGTKKGKSRAQY